MIDWIKEIDSALLLFINGMHTPILDEIMWIITSKFTWLPFYLFLFILVYQKYSLKQAVWFTIIGLMAVGCSDFITTYGFKYNFMRYRPSHHLELGQLLHFYEIRPGDLYKGGQYGFTSGHAANSMVIALFFILQLREKVKIITPFLLLWLILVCYSRMYLGVHYPTDILGGLIVGSIVALSFHWVYRKLILDKTMQQK